MVYRNGTYIAFDGLGEVDPSKSDYKYYAMLQAWRGSKQEKFASFNFVNSHEKASVVRDTSKRETLRASIRKRLSNSKNLLAIFSSKTRLTGSELSYEIEYAVDNLGLPVICCYPDVRIIGSLNVKSLRRPKAMQDRIDLNRVKALHVPFDCVTIYAAIN